MRPPKVSPNYTFQVCVRTKREISSKFARFIARFGFFVDSAEGSMRERERENSSQSSRLKCLTSPDPRPKSRGHTKDIRLTRTTQNICNEDTLPHGQNLPLAEEYVLRPVVQSYQQPYAIRCNLMNKRKSKRTPLPHRRSMPRMRGPDNSSTRNRRSCQSRTTMH